MSQLTNYIQKELDKGFSKDIITKKLLQAGYTQQEITDSFKSLKSAEPILRRKFADTLHLETHIQWSKWLFGLLATVVVLVLGFLVYQYSGELPSLPATSTQEEAEPVEEDLLQKEIAACDFAEDRVFCITNLAIEYDDSTICDIGVSCTASLAAAQKDGSLCLSLAEKWKQESCLSQYYELTGDPTYCTSDDMYCGYDSNTTDEEKRLYFTQKLASADLETIEEDILEFAIDEEEAIMCEFWRPGTEASFAPLLETYTLEPHDFCLVALTYYTQNDQYCDRLIEKNKNVLCLDMLNCDTTTEYREICDALE